EGEFQETKTLGIVIAGNWNQESWNQKQEKVDILQLKGTLEQILRRLKIQDYQLDLNPTTYEDNGIDYNLQENKIAHLAKLSSTLLKKFDIDKEVYYAEIYLTPVLDNLIQSNKLQHQLISKFPSVRRDLALLLDAQITYQDIKNLVIKSNDVLVKNVNLFDVYEGDKLPEGKKSYAISIHLQDENKTMTDKQIDQ